jgi:hypothetical protein
MRNTIIPVALLSLALNACMEAMPSAKAGNGDVNHRVRKGETLFAIAEHYYGNGLEWPRLWESNPHVDPDHLYIGDIIYVPPMGRTPARTAPRGRFTNPSSVYYEKDSGAAEVLVSSDAPGAGRMLWRDIVPQITGKTFFGLSLDKLLFLMCAWFLFHAALQGFMVWIAANITFVKDASFQKAMKATFLTETLALCTVLLVAGIGLMMVYVGTNAPGSGGGQLFPTVEEYVRHPVGMGLCALAVLFLYVVLSLRFIPQIFGMQMGRAFTIVFLAILLPHLMGLYMAGRRMGLLE